VCVVVVWWWRWGVGGGVTRWPAAPKNQGDVAIGTTGENPGGDARGGPLEWGSWGCNLARARCSEAAPS
jgi:hypothetical protein